MRIHINMKVKDLAASISFYSRLFGAGPTVRKSDYARWMLDDPRVNFAIGLSGESPGIEHLGIQAESRNELASLRRRLEGVGNTVAKEGEIVCCYAQSDKSWVEDDQGLRWEVFYTHGSVDKYYGGPKDDPPLTRQACCRPDCCDGGEEAQPS